MPEVRWGPVRRPGPGHRPALWPRVGTDLALGRTQQALADLAELRRSGAVAPGETRPRYEEGMGTSSG